MTAPLVFLASTLMFPGRPKIESLIIIFSLVSSAYSYPTSTEKFKKLDKIVHEFAKEEAKNWDLLNDYFKKILG